MFGSIFRMQAQPGKKDELVKLLTASDRTIPGALSIFLFDTGGDEAWGVGVFTDEAAYRKNADSPEQNKNYGEMRALLTADPEWHDGTVYPHPTNKS